MNTQASDVQAGFYYQNLIAALKVLKLLEDDNVQSVVIEKENAPHIDDVFVHRRDKAIFYQAKFDNHPNPKNLTNSVIFGRTEGQDSLWRKLARGWKHCKQDYEHIEVVLITNKPLSARSSLVAGTRFISPTNLNNRLLIPCRQAVQKGRRFRPPKELREEWRKIQALSELGHDFDAFVACLRFEANSDSKDVLKTRIVETLSNIVGDYRDAVRLRDSLITHVVDWASCRGEEQRSITRERIERALGLAQRRELRHRHELSLPSDYTPFGNLLANIWKKVSELKKGYIFVRGVPGSGKTVAITALLKDHQEIDLRYYAYDPDEHRDRTERVQNKDFYYDLLIQLSRRFPGNYKGPQYPNPERWQENSKAFWKEIERLTNEGNKPFITVIDGLDHAARCRPEEFSTFLENLPQPENLKNDQIFILAGQPGWPKYPNWLEAFGEEGLDIDFYARRELPQNEVLPWFHIDPGVSDEYLRLEYEKALIAEESRDCRDDDCNQCGLERWIRVCPPRK